MGRGVSLAFDTSASLSRLVEWTSAALPKLQNFAAYCRKVDPLPVHSRPDLSLDLFVTLFSGFEALRKFTFRRSNLTDSTASGQFIDPLNAAEDAKALGKICPTLVEVSLYGSHFTRKNLVGWTLWE